MNFPQNISIVKRGMSYLNVFFFFFFFKSYFEKQAT